MRTLIVIGATGQNCPTAVQTTIAKKLAHLPDVLYADDREVAFRHLQENPKAFVAYAPGCFGFAVTRADTHPDCPKIVSAQPQIALTVMEDGQEPEEWHETDDPRQHLWGAALILRVSRVYNALNVAHMQRLDLLLDVQ